MTTHRNRRTGLFIAIDGPSGVGKSTLARHLTGRLQAEGHDVHLTTEPSTGPIGTLARTMTDTASGTVLACLYTADRYHHLDTEIRPRLAAGHTVISDRYLASGLVMQRLDGLNPDYLHTINAHADLPHLSIILTADPATVHGRLAERGTHNRYQRRSDSSSTEVSYYASAADRLEQAGAPTLRLDTTGLSPALVTDHVLNRIATASDAALTHTLEPQ